MCTEKMQNRRNRSDGLLPFVFFSSFSSVSANCVSPAQTFSSRLVWYRIFRRGPRSLPAQICTRISISSSRTSRAFLLLSKLVLECASRPSFTEKPAADKKRKAEVRGGESPDEDRRERREETRTRGREAPRRWSPLFTFRTNSISSGFCLIANATSKRKRWARRSAEAAVASSGTLGVQNFVYKRNRLQ